MLALASASFAIGALFYFSRAKVSIPANTQILSNAEKLPKDQVSNFKKEKFTKLYDIYQQENKFLKEKDSASTSLQTGLQTSPLFIPHIQPILELDDVHVVLKPNRTQHPIRVKTELPKPLGFVVQFSLNPNFSKEASRIFWSESADMKLNFPPRTGQYYYRFRTVTQDQELSSWSDTISFSVRKSIDKNRIAIAETKTIVDASDFQIRKPASIPETFVSTAALPLSDPSWNLQKKSAWLSFGIDQVVQKGSNVFGSNQGNANGYAALLAGDHWWNAHGIHASLSSGVGEAQGYTQAQAHYQYRFRRNLSNGLQWSLLGGVETQKQSKQYLSSQYSLLKLGTAFEFALFNRAVAKFDIHYGVSAENNKKYSTAGQINYFITSDWSAGVGYQLNLFIAGETKASPDGLLPYREINSGAFSALKYYFK